MCDTWVTSPCQPCPRAVRRDRSTWSETNRRCAGGGRAESSFRLHHVQKPAMEDLHLGLPIPRRKQANGSRGLLRWASQRNRGELVQLSQHLVPPSIYIFPALFILIHVRWIHKKTPSQLMAEDAPSSWAITTLLSQRPRGWSDRGGNARTDSCMSRGRTAAQVGDVLFTVLSCRACAFRPSAQAEGPLRKRQRGSST